MEEGSGRPPGVLAVRPVASIPRAGTAPIQGRPVTFLRLPFAVRR